MSKVQSKTKSVFKIKLRKHDLVVVLSGRLKGQTGRVLATHPRRNQVTVENMNLVKKHLKPNKQYPQGAIIEINQPLSVAKVALLEPQSKRASRLQIKLDKDGRKQRVYQKTQKPVVANLKK